MIRDITLKTLLIPLLGLLLPLFTGVLVKAALQQSHLAFSLLYFLIVSFLIWQLTVAIATYVRYRKPALKNILYKLVLLVFSIGLSVALVAGGFVIIWQKLFTGSYQKSTALNFSLSYSCTAILIGLVYEILFLQKEAELETKIVNQLDLERQYAEMHVLKNELEPHFIFNALTSLSQLIITDPQKALLYNARLAQVYRYLLQNKQCDLILLKEELRFIKAYFFLLQIRYGEKLKLEIHIEEEPAQEMMILPCALQLLLENAIKHNSFSEQQPLQVLIYLNKNQLYITNNRMGKSVKVPSTRIGLKNLNNRYRLLCRQEIVVNKTRNSFLVKLPLIKPTEV